MKSVGIIPQKLPFTTSNTIVRTFRHAVSLDERRAKFKANLWNRPNKDEINLGFHEVEIMGPNVPVSNSPPASPSHTVSPSDATDKTFVRSNSQHERMAAMENKYGTQSTTPTDIEEVWFSGCHCGQSHAANHVHSSAGLTCTFSDVGGGSVDNNTPHTLARISLRWMVRECFKTQTGIMFESDRLREIGLDPASLYPHVRRRPDPLPVEDRRLRSRNDDVKQRVSLANPAPSVGAAAGTSTGVTTAAAPPTKAMTEEEHELHDALSPLYDQLELAWSWWILELFPVQDRYQLDHDDHNHWVTPRKLNLGSGRYIPRVNGVKVHRSVKLRMEAQPGENQKKAYAPKAWVPFEPEWVD